jgi:hypothetical protein
MLSLVAKYCYLPAASECGCIWTHSESEYVLVHYCSRHEHYFLHTPPPERRRISPTLRGKDRVLCSSHQMSGAPAFHTPGCEACELSQSRGVVRPVADFKISSKKRARKATDLYEKLGDPTSTPSYAKAMRMAAIRRSHLASTVR